MKVYFHYPKSHVYLHTNSNCNDIKLEARANERVVIITHDNLADVMQLLIKQNWKFSTGKGKDDLWLDLTLNNAKLEESLAFVVKAILGSYYKNFRDAEVTYHC